MLPDGHEMQLPPPDPRVLRHDGVELVEERGPSYLLGNLVMITGQIHRTTDFETGFPIHFARIGKHWQADPIYPRRPGAGGEPARQGAGGV